MDRRRLLVLVSGLSIALSGCSIQDDSSSPSSSSSSPDTPTAPPEQSPEAPVVSGVSVPPCPERPDAFTRESARRFAFQFEKASLGYRTAREQTGLVSVDVDVLTGLETSVTRADGGWTVRFYVEGPATRYEDGTHSDPGQFRVHYFVSEERTLRVEALEGTPDPRERGTEVRCPPE